LPRESPVHLSDLKSVFYKVKIIRPQFL